MYPRAPTARGMLRTCDHTIPSHSRAPTVRGMLRTCDHTTPSHSRAPTARGMLRTCVHATPSHSRTLIARDCQAGGGQGPQSGDRGAGHHPAPGTSTSPRPLASALVSTQPPHIVAHSLRGACCVLVPLTKSRTHCARHAAYLCPRNPLTWSRTHCPGLSGGGWTRAPVRGQGCRPSASPWDIYISEAISEATRKRPTAAAAPAVSELF
jgi:hypothetical protein